MVNTAYVWDCAYQHIIRHKTGTWGESYGKEVECIETGDEISMYLDFTKGTLCFSVNGKSLGIAHAIDPDKRYRGGAFLYRENEEIKLISYQQLS